MIFACLPDLIIVFVPEQPDTGRGRMMLRQLTVRLNALTTQTLTV